MKMPFIFFMIYGLFRLSIITSAAEKTGSVSGKVVIDPDVLFPRDNERLSYRDGGKRKVAVEGIKEQRMKAIKDVTIFVADEAPMDGLFGGRSYDVSGTGKSAEMIQKNKTFTPHVLPVVIGTTVRFPNKDPFYHNVFSFTRGNKFDLGKYSKESPAKEYKFENSGVKMPGVIEIFCDIHRRMKAYVLVLENPFFVKPDDRGLFRINEIPLGKWQIYVWHPSFEYVIQTIEIQPNSEVELEPISIGK